MSKSVDLETTVKLFLLHVMSSATPNVCVLELPCR